MIAWLMLAMVVIPAVELFLLLQLGSWLGPWQTFAIVVVTGTLGAWLAKREGLGVLLSLQRELAQGLPPGSRLAEGVLVLVGGILLITPGVLTDLTGFLFIAPPTRRWLAPRVVQAVTSRIDFVTLGPDAQAPDSEGPTVERRGARPQRRVRTEADPFASPFDDLP